MILTIFRHGIAEDFSADGSDDARELTELGVEKTKQAALGLARISDPPDVILTSPLVRAAQTAKIAGKIFNADTQAADVIGSQDVGGILAMVRRRAEDHVMIVGHNPSFEMIVETVIAAGRAQSRGTVQMKKAGAAQFVISETDAQLLWLATPKMLRLLGGTDE